MKLIYKLLFVLFLALSLSLISSNKIKTRSPAAVTAAVLASPEAFSNALSKFVNIPNEFKSKYEETRQSISKYRKELGTAIMINITNKECSVQCKDGNSMATHYLTIRGKNTVGPNSTMNINASGSSPTLRCYVKTGTEAERGPYTMARGSTYTWSKNGSDLFIPK